MALTADERSIPELLERLVDLERDLQTVADEMAPFINELCRLLQEIRTIERQVHGNAPSKVTEHFVTGLQFHDLFVQRVRNALRIINDVVTSEGRHSAPWIYKATWLGGALVEEARREYVRGFNEISLALTNVVHAEYTGYLPTESSEVVRPMSVSLAAIRPFGNRIREVSNVLEALGRRAYEQVVASGGETDVSASFSALLAQYSFADEEKTHHLIFNLPPPNEPALQPGEFLRL